MISCEGALSRTSFDRLRESDKNYYTKMDPEGFGRLFQVMSPAANLEKEPKLMQITELFNFKMLNFTDFTFEVLETGKIMVSRYISRQLTANGHFIVYPIRNIKTMIVIDFIRKESIKTERIIFFKTFRRREYFIRECFAHLVEVNLSRFAKDFYRIPRKVVFGKNKNCIKPLMLSTYQDLYFVKLITYNIQLQKIVLTNFTKLDFSIDVSGYLRFVFAKILLLNFTATKVDIVISRLKDLPVVCLEVIKDSKFSGRHFMVLGIRNKKNRPQSDWLFSQEDIIDPEKKLDHNLITWKVYKRIIFEKKFLDLCCSGMFDEKSYFAALPYEIIGEIGKYYRKIS